MCGFVGAFGGHSSADDVAQALNVISYRGPHGIEQIENGRLQLSACRLAIVPPLDAPPLVKGQNYLLALNGEVYDLSCCPKALDQRTLNVLLKRYCGWGGRPYLSWMGFLLSVSIMTISFCSHAIALA